MMNLDEGDSVDENFPMEKKQAGHSHNNTGGSSRRGVVDGPMR